MNEINYKPIAIFSCSQVSPVESPRQGVLANESRGQIHLSPEFDLQCLDDLLGFERIWLIYDFHKNNQWNVKVRPPRGSSKKRGVFATRSPYRPNSIGMSCVRLNSINDRIIDVSQHDLLDQTPILDIKPYLPYCDSFNESKIGWLEDIKKYEIHFSKEAELKVQWLQKKLSINLIDIIVNQLEFEPTNKKIKRVKMQNESYIYSYKTWRFLFEIKESKIYVFDVKSGYDPLEIEKTEDLVGDKPIHQIFNREFT
jgi:tRNA (adenine37-N6)-methyltransferase